MNNCIAALNSLNKCIKAEKVLSSHGYFCKIISLDNSLTRNGCAYGIEFSCSENDDIRKILRTNRIDVTEFVTDRGKV